MGQRFSFALGEQAIAEAGGVSLKQLHFEVDAMVRAYEAAKPIAARLGVPPPVVRLAGFAYPHIASLGAVIEFPDEGEPKPLPLLQRPEEIDRLREPEDYLGAPLIRQRLELCAELRRR